MQSVFPPALLLTVALIFTAGCSFEPPRDPSLDRLAAVEDELRESARAGRAPTGPLALAEAVDFAMKNNLSIRAAELEYAIEHEIKTAARLKNLPSLQAGLGLSGRNHYNASSSESLSSGRQSLEPSFSSEKIVNPYNLSVAWSLLDFGLGMIRARQAGEREFMAGEKLRRLRQQIVMDVSAAYYRLCAEEEILRRWGSLESALRRQIDRYRDEAGERNISESERSLRSAPLLSGLRALRGYRRERELARANLAKAMGVTVPGGVAVSRAGGWPEYSPAVPGENDGLEALHRQALISRPEMYNADGETRISVHEARAALLQLAPNVNLSASLQHNGDKFLVYHNWMEAALQVSWDLLRFPAKRREARTAKQKAELAGLRRRVVAASILTQVNLALVEFNESRDRLDLAAEIEENRLAILHGAQDGADKGKSHEGDILTERIHHIAEVANRGRAIADCLIARARLYSALGLEFDASLWDIGPAAAGDVPVAELEKREAPLEAAADGPDADVSHGGYEEEYGDAFGDGEPADDEDYAEEDMDGDRLRDERYGNEDDDEDDEEEVDKDDDGEDADE